MTFEEMLAELGVTLEQARAISEVDVDLIGFPEGPLNVRIDHSTIEGQGVFAIEYLEPKAYVAPMRIKGCRTPAGRYTNHAFEPNAQAQPTGTGDIYLQALKFIAPGDEVTIDYRQMLEMRRRFKI